MQLWYIVVLFTTKVDGVGFDDVDAKSIRYFARYKTVNPAPYYSGNLPGTLEAGALANESW